MAAKTEKVLTNPRDIEIARLRKIDRQKRSEQQTARLAELLAEDRRDRWNRLHPGRIKRLAGALKGLMALSNPASYQYTPEEAQAIVDSLTRKLGEVKAAFLGAPSEKGMFDM